MIENKSFHVLIISSIPDERLPFFQVLREIKALQHIDFHPNIVKLREIFPHGTGFVLVFEYMLSGEF